MWTEKFLNPERKCCRFKNIWILERGLRNMFKHEKWRQFDERIPFDAWFTNYTHNFNCKLCMRWIFISLLFLSQLTVHVETQTCRSSASLIISKKYQTLFGMEFAFGAVMKHQNRHKNLASGKLWEHVHWRNQDVAWRMISKWLLNPSQGTHYMYVRI